ncbi:hypothetical protein Hypma_014629 [Hypsizygus marmoreus]|uniref:Uncharacterized protein n=1 Tax=Hypsizygus marmoreus TaxID=39966 RepID=A0A369JIV2_HYPMA|nr:hypothetical protein Hypma_014629 [Hypsizygus marmoreus]
MVIGVSLTAHPLCRPALFLSQCAPVLPATVLRRTVLRQRQSPFTATRFASPTPTPPSRPHKKKAQEAPCQCATDRAKGLGEYEKALEPAGQKFGQLLGSYKQPLQYNLAVTREVLKQIYVAEGLQPPTLAAVREAYATIWTRPSAPLTGAESHRVGNL